MSLQWYRRISDPTDQRRFESDDFDVHPKRNLWEQFTPPPPFVDPDPPIFKEDLIRRSMENGRYNDLRLIVTAMTLAEQFYFTHVATFTKDDPVYVKIKAEMQR